MTVKYQLTIQELNLDFIRAMQKAFGGKNVTLEIKIQTDEPVPDEEFTEWRKQFMLDSARQLNGVFSKDEPEYSEIDLLKTNPEFNPEQDERR